MMRVTVEDYRAMLPERRQQFHEFMKAARLKLEDHAIFEVTIRSEGRLVARGWHFKLMPNGTKKIYRHVDGDPVEIWYLRDLTRT
jgi:hypothetical protein